MDLDQQLLPGQLDGANYYSLHSPFLFSPRGVSDGGPTVISSQLSVPSEMIQRRG